MEFSSVRGKEKIETVLFSVWRSADITFDVLFDFQKELFGAGEAGQPDGVSSRKMSNGSTGSTKHKWLKAFKSLKTSSPTTPPSADKSVTFHNGNGLGRKNALTFLCFSSFFSLSLSLIFFYWFLDKQFCLQNFVYKWKCVLINKRELLFCECFTNTEENRRCTMPFLQSSPCPGKMANVIFNGVDCH